MNVKLNQSEIEVAKNMRFMPEKGIKAHYISACTRTTKDSDFIKTEE